LARAGALEFSWSPSAEADLAGYRVYRAPRGGRAELLAELPKSTTLHRDADVRQGVVHVYTVTAVDAAGNESPPSAGAQGSPE
jgi:fibronectin type 3 domain-containing protein